MGIKDKLIEVLSRHTKAPDSRNYPADCQPGNQEQEEVDARRDEYNSESLAGQPGPSISKLDPANKASDTPIDELWSLAYEHLRESDRDLIVNYEDKLCFNLAVAIGSTHGSTLRSTLRSRAELRYMMKTILQRKMDEVNRDTWKVKFRSSEVQVKDLVQPVLGVINWANEYVSAAVKASPSASIAWAGISLLLPLFLNPSKQAVSLAKGLEHVSSLIARSCMWESLYIRRRQSKPNGNGPTYVLDVDSITYKDSLEMLYQHILRFQITGYCYYANDTALRFSQDLVQWNEWDTLLNKIRDQEATFATINSTWRDSTFADECSAAERRHEEAMCQWQCVGKDVSGLLDAIRKARKEKKRSKLLQWLCSVDPSEAYNAARDKHIGGTSDWLLKESEEYENWEKTPSSLLWLRGKAGCGKSILSSSVINDIKNRHRSDPQIALAYFFFSFSDLRKQKVDVMLASLVKQLYASRPDTPEPIASLEGYKTRGEWPDTETLESALLATTRGFAATFIIIDALDECPSLDGEREKLMTSFCRIIGAIPNNVHILCTSRAEADIVAAMSSVSCATKPPRAGIDLNEQRERMNCDISLYIDSTLASSAYSSWPNDLKLEVREVLIEKAEGMFQYVSSQFEGLKRASSPKAVREAIYQLPTGLDATYDRILLSLDFNYRTQITSSLRWLASSTRDLTVEELAEVFILHPTSDVPFDEAERLFKPEDCIKYLSNLVVTVTNKAETPTEDIVLPEDFGLIGDWTPEDLLSAEKHEMIFPCEAPESSGTATRGEPFEEAESSENEDSSSQSCNTFVRLAHFTVKEYLISDRITRGPAASFSFTETDAHLHIVRSSLPYHLQCDHSSTETKIDFKLNDYTFENWAFHLEMVPRTRWTPDLVHLALRGLALRSSRERIGIIASINPLVAYATILDGPQFYTARQGFAQLTKLLFDGGPGTNPYLTQQDLDLVLLEAAKAGQYAVVKLLLAKGAGLNAENEIHGGALQAAAFAGHKEVVQLLLKNGADIDAHRGRWGSAIQAAVCGHQVDTVQCLLQEDKPAKVGCALILACRQATYPRHLECLNALLAKGADINRQCDIHGTALHEAAVNNDGESFHLLLEKGADVNLLGGEYGYPLQALCQKQDASISDVTQLLDRGANVNAQGGRYGSALQALFGNHFDDMYIRHFDKDIAMVLLERGADVDMQGGLYGSALAAACMDRVSGTGAVWFLVQNGADTSIKNQRVGGALHAACLFDNLEIVRLLLHLGADVNAPGGVFGSALQISAFAGGGEILSLLLSKEADVHAMGGNRGTALQGACLYNRIDDVRILLDHGADVNVVFGEHGTALQAACSTYDNSDVLDIPHLLIEHGADVHVHGGELGSSWHAAAARMDVGVEALLDLLLDHGVNIDEVRGGRHGNALQAALQLEPAWRNPGIDLAYEEWDLKKYFQDRVDRVRFLLDRGAHVNIGGGKYAFPLQSACAKEHNSKLTRLLIDTCPDIDVNATGGLFGSALQAAAHSRQEDSVRLLLDKSADINARGGRYGSALNAAVFRGFWEIVEVLLERGAIPDSQQLPEPDEQFLAGVEASFADEEWIADDYFTTGCFDDLSRSNLMERPAGYVNFGPGPYASRRDVTEKTIARMRVDAGRRAVGRYRKFWDKTRVKVCVSVCNED